MERKTTFLTAAFIVLSVILSACIGLIPLKEEPTTGSFGPSYSHPEHQTRVFDAIWAHLQESYIHYESENVDWDALNKEYLERINAGLQSGGRAEVVGATTPGAVEITTPFYLPNGALIFIESTSFRLLNGEEIGNNGVRPDVEVEAGWDEILPDADPVLEAAIKLLDAQE